MAKKKKKSGMGGKVAKSDKKMKKNKTVKATKKVAKAKAAPKPKYKVGEVWANRNGDEVKIYANDHEGDFPVVARRTDGESRPHAFTRLGRVELKGTDSLDLVKKVANAE